MKSKLLLILSIAFALNGINAQSVSDTLLTTLINKALNASEKLKTLRVEKAIAKNGINIGTNLPDPVLTVGVANLPVNSFSFTQEPMTGKVIGISQAFPFPAKLSSMKKSKAVDTLIVDEKSVQLKNSIVFEIKTLYYDLALVNIKTNLVKKRKSLLEQIAKVTEQNYAVGKSSLQNLLQTNVDILKLQEELINLENKRKGLTAKINTYLHQDENTAIPVSENFAIEFRKINRNEITNLVYKNPLLKSAALGVKKSELLLTAKKYELYPNFKIAFQYNQRDYSGALSKDWTDLVSLVVGISIPVDYGNGKSSEIEEANLLKKYYDARYNSELENLTAQISLLVSETNSLYERILLVEKKLLPEAEKALQAAKTDYETAKIDFSNLLGSENQLLKIETTLYEMKFSFLKKLARLEFLTGSKIDNKIFTE